MVTQIEIIPPVDKNGRTSVVGISYGIDESITISHYTKLIGETDNEKIRNPEDYKSITIPIEQLKWLAPRLNGLRQFLKIEDGYEQNKK